MKRKAAIISVLGLAVFYSTSTFGVTIYNIDLFTQFGGYGNINQNSPGILNGGNACGPTATYNSFVYLKNRGITGILDNDTGNSATSAINQLGALMLLPQNQTTGGVFDQNFIAGKKSWIDTYNSNHTASTQMKLEVMADVNATSSNGGSASITQGAPTLKFIKDQLAAGQDVEIGFNWSNGSGGHWVTATSINWVDQNDDQIFNGTDTASIDFVDPWGPKSGTGSAPHILSSIITNGTGIAAGHLVMAYSGGGAGDATDPENPGAASSGYIDIVAAESPVGGFPVPEPGSLMLVVAAGSTLLLKRFRRRDEIPGLTVTEYLPTRTPS